MIVDCRTLGCKTAHDREEDHFFSANQSWLTELNMSKKNEPATPRPNSGWGEFLHWVYCPDAPGPCKCKPQ